MPLILIWTPTLTKTNIKNIDECQWIRTLLQLQVHIFLNVVYKKIYRFVIYVYNLYILKKSCIETNFVESYDGKISNVPVGLSKKRIKPTRFTILLERNIWLINIKKKDVVFFDTELRFSSDNVIATCPPSAVFNWLNDQGDLASHWLITP